MKYIIALLFFFGQVCFAQVSNALKEGDEPFLFFGDFRYRHQTETQEPKDQRVIQRIQARFGVSSQIQSDLKVTLRLMTGGAANSGNQTLGDEKAPGMPRRSMGLDQAFFEYNPVKDLGLLGGKMPQVFSFAGKNQMLLDRDITPEGIALKYTQPLDENLKLYLQGGMFWVRENYDSQFGDNLTDNFLNAIQLGFKWTRDDWKVNLGAGMFSYTDLRDTPPGNITSGATGNGNTLDLNGNYPTNFDIQEVLLEVTRKIQDVDVTLFYEVLQNKDVSSLGHAHSYGVLISQDPWGLSFYQQEVQKDAVVGVFTDSDFGGGVTSTRGWVGSIGYQLSKKVQLQYTQYVNENSIDLIAARYDRSHLDLLIKF